MDIYIGFDSAWADNPKARGAICAVGIEDGRSVRFHDPQAVSFDQAFKFIQDVRSDIDRNASGGARGRCARELARRWCAAGGR
jgi:predicted RNase H-like nuclease